MPKKPKLTKAQKLGITQFPYVERDERGMISYIEFETGYWARYVNNFPGSFSRETSTGVRLNIEFLKGERYVTTDETGKVEFRQHSPIGPDSYLDINTVPKS